MDKIIKKRIIQGIFQIIAGAIIASVTALFLATILP